MRGVRRTREAAPTQKAPAVAEQISTMLAATPAATLQGKRDRALLLLGFAGVFRRAELVAFEFSDLAFAAEGLPRFTTRCKRPRSTPVRCSAASTGMDGCWAR